MIYIVKVVQQSQIELCICIDIVNYSISIQFKLTLILELFKKKSKMLLPEEAKMCIREKRYYEIVILYLLKS